MVRTSTECLHVTLMVRVPIIFCALGFSPVDTMIPAEAASKATSLWPIKRRVDGRGLQKLNRFQKQAIQLACNSNNKFVVIQGPPGKLFIPCVHLHSLSKTLNPGTKT